MSPDPEEPPTPPVAAADKPPGDTPAEPLKGEVSRSESPGAGASAAPAPPVEPAKPAPAAPKPAAPAAAAAKPAPAAAAAKPAAGAAAAKPAASAAAAKPAAAAHAAPAAPPAGPTDPPPPADAQLPSFIVDLQAALPDAVTQVSFYVGDWTVIVPAARLLEVGAHLRDTPAAAFDFCSDVTASDWPPRPQRFDLVYCLYSTRHRHRVRMKVRAAEHDPVPSVSRLWPAANWLEREVYDMFGVNFVGHPDRRRILMPDEWQGYPQRKDYPLEGPGELLMESPQDWLKIRNAPDEME